MDSESNDLSHELLDSRDAARQPAFSDELQANILDFYEVPEHDALHINWRHAVNSRKKLASALADETVHMLECDVILSAEDSVPICAHPPQTQSDLTVLSLLETLLAAGTKKGLKLDFKQFEAVRATLSIIGSRRFRNELRVPIWFNADVLSGPGGLLTPHIDARKFLQECLSTFRWATFSLGWTTGDGSRANSAKVMHYTPAMIREMLNLLAEFELYTDTDVVKVQAAQSSQNVAQTADDDSTKKVQVTFPVNALLLTGSLNALYDLVGLAPASFSLTVWSPFGEDLQRVPKHVLHDTRTALRQLRAVFDRRSVFYDLDPSLRSALLGSAKDGEQQQQPEVLNAPKSLSDH